MRSSLLLRSQRLRIEPGYLHCQQPHARVSCLPCGRRAAIAASAPAPDAAAAAAALLSSQDFSRLPRSPSKHCGRSFSDKGSGRSSVPSIYKRHRDSAVSAAQGTAVSTRRGPGRGDPARPRITVLGAGVIGLSAATVIAEAFPGGSVTIEASEFLEETTSWGAAGLWEPYKLGAEQDPQLINRWGGETYRHFSALHASAAGPTAGCIATTGYALWTGGANEPPVTEPTWRDVVSHFHRLSATELGAYAQPYVGGWSYSTFICEGSRYLPWLTARFERAGGRLQRAEEVSCMEELRCLAMDSECDVLVNCTGLGAVPASPIFGDDSTYPIRGQVLRVKAPWLKSYYNIDGAYYAIPNIVRLASPLDRTNRPKLLIVYRDTVVLGGTSQYVDEVPEQTDRDPSEADRQAILNNVCAHLPALRDAEIVSDWVGYRPGRPSVRLELVSEQLDNGMVLPTVHSYGHGGAGITLSWGAALDTLALVREALA